MWVTKAGTETQKEQKRGAFNCSVCLHEKKHSCTFYFYYEKRYIDVVNVSSVFLNYLSGLFLFC